jgi:NAD(P)-dependent dehydrogenase (short-subunit alcohol dehydrogenase family)
MEIKRKIALVTGGSRGLGKNMAISLARKGIDVILTYKKQKKDALAVVAEIEKMGQRSTALQLNTGDVKSFDTFIGQLKEVLKNVFAGEKLDFLVNNAGNSLHALINETSEEQFDETMNVHFKGVFFLTQKLLSYLNDGGGIVNISSGLARFSHPGSSVYASMKGAVEVLTRYMAKELGARQINVNTVAPGAIETDFSGGLVRDNKDVNKRIAGVTAMGRVGLPEDIGGVVAFLCTPEAKWINAQRIEVSGGMNI